MRTLTEISEHAARVHAIMAATNHVILADSQNREG